MSIIFMQLADQVIRPTLNYLGLGGVSALNLLLGTAAQESACEYLLQTPSGPARGFWQIEPATHQDVLNNFLAFRPDLKARVDNLAYTGFDRDSQLADNLKYACAIARLVYFRMPEPLPNGSDVAALAAYWKTHYNTAGGAGAIDQFIANFSRYIGDPLNA